NAHPSVNKEQNTTTSEHSADSIQVYRERGSNAQIRCGHNEVARLRVKVAPKIKKNSTSMRELLIKFIET
ncbi:MAG: hypothetical protein Q9226_006483, partial [Calogaya cf. arnoldii]